jgi:putative endonuclease
MYYVYVLRSEKDGRLYTGYSKDMESRLKVHNQGKVRSTKSRRPYVVVYFEEYKDKRTARKRELFLKSGKGRSYLREVGINNRIITKN